MNENWVITKVFILISNIQSVLWQKVKVRLNYLKSFLLPINKFSITDSCWWCNLIFRKAKKELLGAYYICLCDCRFPLTIIQYSRSDERGRSSANDFLWSFNTYRQICQLGTEGPKQSSYAWTAKTSFVILKYKALDHLLS